MQASSAGPYLRRDRASWQIRQERVTHHRCRAGAGQTCAVGTVTGSSSHVPLQYRPQGNQMTAQRGRDPTAERLTRATGSAERTCVRLRKSYRMASLSGRYLGTTQRIRGLRWSLHGVVGAQREDGTHEGSRATSRCSRTWVMSRQGREQGRWAGSSSS